MSSYDGLVDAPGPGLPDAPVEVDDEVVSDVIPAVDIAVEFVDRPQHRRHLSGRVAVGVVRVVHETELDGPVFGRDPRRLDALGPGLTGDYRRLTGAGGDDRGRQRQGRRKRARGAPGSTPDQMQAGTVEGHRAAQLQCPSSSGPKWLPDDSRVQRRFGAVAVGPGRGPWPPPPALQAQADLRIGAGGRPPLKPHEHDPGGQLERRPLPHRSQLDHLEPRAGRPAERPQCSPWVDGAGGERSGAGEQQRAAAERTLAHRSNQHKPRPAGAGPETFLSIEPGGARPRGSLTRTAHGLSRGRSESF